MISLISAVYIYFSISFVSTNWIAQIEPSNFETYKNNAPMLFVRYYAPWCGYCKDMEGAFKEVAAEVNADDILLGEVDCEKNPAFCQQQMVNGYPDLKLYMNGQTLSYDGPRTKQSMVKFLQDQERQFDNFKQ